jgi:gamma-glutamyltranspeptidase/glutathione hydrolase
MLVGCWRRRSIAALVALFLGCGVRTSTDAALGAMAPSATPARPPAVSGAAPAEPQADRARAASPEEPPDPRIEIKSGGTRAVRAEQGAVTSVEANATRIGVGILERGGTAVDAAVAVAYALAVTHPSAGNIGGGGFMLVRPAKGPTVAIDFRETAPASLDRKHFDAMIAAGASGPEAVGVPGTVAGLSLAHERLGKLPLAELIAPAIELARRGHRIGERQAKSLAWAWPKLRLDPTARAIFGAANGGPKKAGSVLKRPLLATSLQRIADRGRAGFYEGETAAAIIAASAGAISADDLKKYRAKLREPLGFRYRGLRVEVMPPPSAGGVTVMAALLMLDALDVHDVAPNTAQELHLFIEASRRAQAERRFNVADPDRWSQAELEQRLSKWRDATTFLRSVPIDRAQATRSEAAHPLYPVALRELEHTTHFSVIDGDGNIVSCTTTLSAGFGAKLVVPGLDIVLNNSVAAFGTAGSNQPAPGFRTTSSMAPTLVLRDERPVLVLGSPGGDTIPSTVTQVLRNVVDHGMAIDAAIEAPRIHHGFAPDTVFYERDRRPPKRLLTELEKMGHHVRQRAPIGDANNLLIDSEGVVWAYADPREGGLALAAKPKR